jgi:hypothetical protein
MEKELTPSSVGMKYGLIYGLVSILLSAFSLLILKTTQGPIQWIGFVLPIVFLVLAMREFKNQGDGFMGFGQGFSIGFLVSLISGLLSSVFTYIYLKYIDDSVLREIWNQQVMEMESRGINMNDMPFDMEAWVTSPEVTSGSGFLMLLIIGIIFTLIISAIMKKDRPEFGM